MSAHMHRCDKCGYEHDYPKASRAVLFFIKAAAFVTVQLLAAHEVGGWLAIALLVNALLNVIAVALMIAGLASLAARNSGGRR